MPARPHWPASARSLNEVMASFTMASLPSPLIECIAAPTADATALAFSLLPAVVNDSVSASAIWPSAWSAPARGREVAARRGGARGA
jgi:hypothetical protein